MASKTYTIPNFTKGLFMAWNMNTQAAFDITVTLKDSSKTYVDHAHQASTNIKPPLAEDSDFIAGDNLQMIVDIPQSSEIKASIHAYTISRDDGYPVGYGFDLAVEDSDDKDYNDLYVALVCWKNKG